MRIKELERVVRAAVKSSRERALAVIGSRDNSLGVPVPEEFAYAASTLAMRVERPSLDPDDLEPRPWI